MKKRIIIYRILGILILVTEAFVASLVYSGIFKKDSIKEGLALQAMMILLSSGLFLLFAVPYKPTDDANSKLVIVWRLAIAAVLCSIIAPMPILYFIEWVSPSGTFNYVGKLLAVVLTIFAILGVCSPHMKVTQNKNSGLWDSIKRKYFR